MKTLKSEIIASLEMAHMFCPSPQALAHYTHGVKDAMAVYGDYRVVEGVLRIFQRLEDGRWEACVSFTENGDLGSVTIGVEHDTVKLILPPEEKGPELYSVESTYQHERDRADRYETALREIADSSAPAIEAVAGEARQIAEGALDEDAER